MDELLKNYIKHIEINFSPTLAKELNEILVRDLINEAPIEVIETKFQNKLVQFFENLKGNDYIKTAKKLYEAYVDYDDENLIRSVRFLIRIYSKFINAKLAKYFCNWRIKNNQIKNITEKQINNKYVNKEKGTSELLQNHMFNKRLNVYDFDKDDYIINNHSNKNHRSNKSSKNIESNNIKALEDKYSSLILEEPKSKRIPYDYSKNIKKNSINKSFNSTNSNNTPNYNYLHNSPANKNRIENIDSKSENNSKTKLINKEEKRLQMKLEKQKNDKNSANSVTIFDKLFLDSYKKNDEKLLNEEIKKLSELDECTFQPNVIKKGSS